MTNVNSQMENGKWRDIYVFISLNIAKFLSKDVTAFDPSRPDPPENFKIPASPLRSEVKPPGN
jgi:hypothetical protein